MKYGVHRRSGINDYVIISLAFLQSVCHTVKPVNASFQLFICLSQKAVPCKYLTALGMLNCFRHAYPAVIKENIINSRCTLGFRTVGISAVALLIAVDKERSVSTLGKYRRESCCGTGLANSAFHIRQSYNFHISILSHASSSPFILSIHLSTAFITPS